MSALSINKLMRYVLKVLSYPDVDIKKTYKIERSVSNIRADKLMNPIHKKWDKTVFRGDKEINVRVYTPKKEYRKTVLLFFHGGGWVIGNIDSYSNVCAHMASMTGCVVVSVDYRLAPEHPFPCGLEDCYAVAREIFLDLTLFGVDKEDIVLIGDSAGGNLAAAVSLKARDRGEFKVTKQILIYPSTHNDHSDETGFPSIREYGTDYLLTSKRIRDYMDLYRSSDEDLFNPYLAPLIADDLSDQPRTLIITAQYDPLRDEGEAYGKKLREHGNTVFIHRMKDSLHGFISLPKHFVHVKRSYQLINEFLNDTL